MDRGRRELMEAIPVFEREVTLSGKVIYKHIENGKARIDLIEATRRGEITPEQMRSQSEEITVSV